ncbi:MAG: NAD(P)H-binding protein [Actinomycetota bacterium]
MRLAILAATGGIGGYLLNGVLGAGHFVQVLARDPSVLPRHPGLQACQGDALDEAAVKELVCGADAVLSALGPRGARSPGLLARAAQSTVTAMQASGARRLICVSAAGAFITGDPDANAVVKLVLPRVLARPFADVRQMEGEVRASGLDWTLVRASRLTRQPGTGQYPVRPDYPPPGGGKIARQDVAHFILAALADGATPRAPRRWRTDGPGQPRWAAMKSRYQPNDAFGVRCCVAKST